MFQQGYQQSGPFTFPVWIVGHGWHAWEGRFCHLLASLSWDVSSEGRDWYTSRRAMARANDLVGQPCPPDLPDSLEVGVLVGVERGDVDRSSQRAPHPPFVWFLLDLMAGFARMIVACVTVPLVWHGLY